MVVQSARQVEYVLVWNKGQLLSGLIQEFIRYIQDCLEEESSGR